MGSAMEFGLPVESCDPSAKPDFNVVIAYDTAPAAYQAMHLVDGLAQQLASKLNLRRNLWRLDILDLPATREAARADASNANLIVVAAYSDTDLPAAVKAWLGGWSARCIAGATALVALLLSQNAPTKRHSAPYRFLRATARKARQTFFAQEYRAPFSNPDITAEEVRRHAETTSSLLLGILGQNRPVSRWGLNE
jgi:hypothetical protein